MSFMVIGTRYGYRKIKPPRTALPVRLGRGQSGIQRSNQGAAFAKGSNARATTLNLTWGGNAEEIQDILDVLLTAHTDTFYIGMPNLYGQQKDNALPIHWADPYGWAGDKPRVHLVSNRALTVPSPSFVWPASTENPNSYGAPSRGYSIGSAVDHTAPNIEPPFPHYTDGGGLDNPWLVADMSWSSEDALYKYNNLLLASAPLVVPPGWGVCVLNPGTEPSLAANVAKSVNGTFTDVTTDTELSSVVLNPGYNPTIGDLDEWTRIDFYVDSLYDFDNDDRTDADFFGAAAYIYSDKEVPLGTVPVNVPAWKPGKGYTPFTFSEDDISVDVYTLAGDQFHTLSVTVTEKWLPWSTLNEVSLAL